MPGVEPTVSTGRHLVLVFAMVGILTTCTGCSNQTSAATKPVPPVVETVEIQQKDVPVYNEWIGTLDGYVNADIKAQVSDYLLEQAYKEGSVVKKGQSLFQIDPRPFQAALDQAQGSTGTGPGTAGAGAAAVPMVQLYAIGRDAESPGCGVFPYLS
jgi:membrane fusion protein (multidrug efflux system)